MSRKSIEECVRVSVERYLEDLRGAEPSDLHALFIAAAEKPLLDAVLSRAEGNQSKAADWLGLHRNTLRRKLREHRLIE